MKTIAEWFTDNRRQALHAALGTIAAFALAAGWINPAQSDALVGLAGSTLALLQGLVSLSLLRPSDAARWFGTVGRGLTFGLATAAGAAGIVFGILHAEQVTHWLGLFSIALTSLSSFLAVVNVQTVDASLSAAEGSFPLLSQSEVDLVQSDPGASFVINKHGRVVFVGSSSLERDASKDGDE